ncbi:hypothetical protein BC629DRAFT_1501084 [Irpex lacteus]|nr:hypothetical protein BC629DRAFT_1501084 [Irpex lacteus]
MHTSSMIPCPLLLLCGQAPVLMTGYSLTDACVRYVPNTQLLLLTDQSTGRRQISFSVVRERTICSWHLPSCSDSTVQPRRSKVACRCFDTPIIDADSVQMTDGI